MESKIVYYFKGGYPFLERVCVEYNRFKHYEKTYLIGNEAEATQSRVGEEDPELRQIIISAVVPD